MTLDQDRCPHCRQPLRRAPRRVCTLCQMPILKHDKYLFVDGKVQHRNCAHPGSYHPPNSPPKCDDCGCEMDRYEDAGDTGKGGWSCPRCNWSWDDDE